MYKFLGLLFALSLIFLVSPAYAKNLDKPHQAVCGKQHDEFNCHARVITDDQGKPAVTNSPFGYGPVQFRNAYGVSGSVTAPQTIAIVDAYDDPNILADLNSYSSALGIPGLSSCPASSGTPTHPCFQKVNQNGLSNYPQKNAGWSLEMSLDVETAHAMCQNCNILLVEANSASYSNLMSAVDQAVTMGAKVVSNSYGSNEFSSETTFDSHFNKPGIAFTFSSGDSGYGASYPAASQYVTAVGGTTLNLNNNNYVSESVWNGAGSGCSVYESKPGFQHDTGCAKRMISDVSADANPNTGAAVYDTTPYQGQRGWFQVGGTSLASPIIAATYIYGGIAGSSMANSLPYANSGALHDVTSGSNGTCSIPYLCNGVSGYDGPSGLGSPNGSAAF